jgi:hypothetical protein
MEMKKVRVLAGSVEAPIDDNLDFVPFKIRDGHNPDFVQAYPMEEVNLPADEAYRLADLGLVEVLL